MGNFRGITKNVPKLQVYEHTPALPTTQSIKVVIVVAYYYLCVHLFGRLYFVFSKAIPLSKSSVLICNANDAKSPKLFML